MKALMKTIILALFLLTGFSYGQDSTQLSQITLLGIPAGGSIPKVRTLVQTEWNGGNYYGWEFVSNANDEYTAFTWFHGAPAIAGRSNIDISQHNFNIRADLVLRTYVEYPEPTVAIVYAYAGASEGTLIEIGNIEVHDGVGVIAKDGFPADGSVPFFAFGGSRRPGMLYHGNSSGITERPLFKLFKDGYLFGSDEADMYVGTFDTPLATYDVQYRDARDGYYVSHLLLEGDGTVKMDGNYNGGFSYYREVLPVELTSFTANVSGNNVNLNWTTATELNNNGFKIQKKSLTSDWSYLGFVAGFGTTTEPKTYSFTDANINAGSFTYRLKQVDFDGSFNYSSVIEVITSYIPTEYFLSDNYPNPFNPVTTIEFSLPEDVDNVKLTIYDVLGQKVVELVNGKLEAGRYSYPWNASKAASGLYIYQLQTNKFTSTRKMLVLK